MRTYKIQYDKEYRTQDPQKLIRAGCCLEVFRPSILVTMTIIRPICPPEICRASHIGLNHVGARYLAEFVASGADVAFPTYLCQIPRKEDVR